MEAIFADMKPGITADRCIRFKPDRRKAIALALKEAQKGDILLHCR
jgi:UDP-N-acetylmuramyl tripeptide synthase